MALPVSGAAIAGMSTCWPSHVSGAISVHPVIRRESLNLGNGFGVSLWSLTCEEVLKAVPHRHCVFSIPKILRRYFLYDRSLLFGLSRCGWESLKVFFQETLPEEAAVPGAVVAIQSFGDFLGFNPHLHILYSDGCFYGEGLFRVAHRFDPTKPLEEIFRHKVFKMLLSKGKMTEDLVDMLMKWRHAGFNVFRV
jgi:hypothetical protein